MITVESKKLVVKRISNDKFEIVLGDLDIDITEFEMKVGETFNIEIPSILVKRESDTAQVIRIN